MQGTKHPLKRDSQSPAPPYFEHTLTENTNRHPWLPTKVSWPIFFGREKTTNDRMVLLVVNPCLEVKLFFPQDFITAVTTGLTFWSLIVSQLSYVS